MKPIRYTLSKQVADLLEEQIASGVYKVGDKIPTEPELIEMFGVSRNTMREGVQALISAGLLEARQGDGTYVVASKRLEVEFFGLLNEGNIEDIKDIKKLLETYAVQKAIENATREDILLIEQTLVERNEESLEVGEHANKDMQFHLAIAKATHNLIFIQLYEYLLKYFNAFVSVQYAKHIGSIGQAGILHEDLVNAIKNKDSEKAKEIVEKIME